MTQSPSSSFVLTRKVADLFGALQHVEAVALGGSQSGGTSDSTSDIDLYVYTSADIPLTDRQAIVEAAGGASKADLGLVHWGPGDEWLDAKSGIEVDIIYFDRQWMDGQIKRVMREHQASLGYTTCFCHTVRYSQIFDDPSGWLGKLQVLCQQAYPDALRRNIIALNHSVLRNVIPSYANQLKKAVKRRDLISINHRLAGLLASYFDVIFAVNRLLHPGEKRLASIATSRCEKLPTEMISDIEAVLQASATADQKLILHLARLLDRLDALLKQEGFDPITSKSETKA